MQTDLLILVVCYNNAAEVSRFVTKEVLSQSFQDYKLIVINNGKEDKQLLQLNDLNGNVKVLQMQNNSGYFGGMNAGLNYFLKENGMPEAIIACNSDLVLPDKDLFAEIIAAKHP